MELTAETLRCKQCGYSAQTAKFLASDSSKTINCPKCSTIGTLVEWRFVEPSPVFDEVKTQKRTSSSLVQSVVVATLCIVNAIGAFACFLFVIGAITAFIDSVDRYPGEETLVLINANLRFFKHALLAFASFRLCIAIFAHLKSIDASSSQNLKP